MKRILNTFSQKWPEYIIEALVIVASILGAYALDNWNEERKEEKQEREYLLSMSEDLESQMTIIERQLDFEKTCNSMLNFILDKGVLNLRNENPDTLVLLLNDLRTRTTFQSIDPTFEDLKSTGNIRLISRPGLKKKVIFYYQELERIERIILSNNEKFVDDTYNNELLKSGLIPIISNTSKIFDRSRLSGIAIHTRKLFDLALRKLDDPENLQTITNLINVRASTPLGHIYILEGLSANTTDLIAMIKDETNIK